jgi:hypothetical protein
VTWDVPLATVKVTTGGVITIDTDERRPIDQGMGAMPGEMRMWEGSLSGGAYPVIGSMIYDEWRAMNAATTYNGHTIRDYSDRAPMGIGTLVTSVGDTAGAATKNLAHTHAVGTLAAANESAHTHAIGTIAAANESAHTHGPGTLATDTEASHAHQQQGTTSGPSAFESDLGEGALSTAASKTHTHTLSGYTVGAGAHNHDVDSGVTAAGSAHTHSMSGSVAAGSAHTHSLSGATASGGSATQDVLNPVFGTYYIKYCPA